MSRGMLRWSPWASPSGPHGPAPRPKPPQGRAPPPDLQTGSGLFLMGYFPRPFQQSARRSPPRCSKSARSARRLTARGFRGPGFDDPPHKRVLFEPAHEEQHLRLPVHHRLVLIDEATQHRPPLSRHPPSSAPVVLSTARYARRHTQFSLGLKLPNRVGSFGRPGVISSRRQSAGSPTAAAVQVDFLR